MNSDQPAFPQIINDMGTLRCVTEGCSKREWFAAMALQGLLANPNAWNEWTLAHHTKQALGAVDALLAELEKKP